MLANLIENIPMLLCLLLGSGLVIIELFLPGVGLPGISGAVLIGAGAIIAAVNYGMLAGVATLLVVIALLALVFSWVLRSASRGAGRRIFLHDKDELRTDHDMQVLVGKTGRTMCALRPAGIGDFDGVRLNVVTEGGYIERDMPIEIVSVSGARIVVRLRQDA